MQYKYDLRNTDKRRITSLAWAALELNLEVFEWLLLDYGHDDHELSRDSAHNTIFHLLAAAPAPPALSPNAEIWAGAPDFPPRPQTRPQAELTDVCLRMTEVYYTLFPFLLDWSNNRGETALHVAAQADNPAFIACLIESGADPNLADLEGNTPLHCAAAWGHTACIRALLERGASVALRNFENFTPADVAYSNSVRTSFEQMARDVVELRRQRKLQQQQEMEYGDDEEGDEDQFEQMDPRFERERYERHEREPFYEFGRNRVPSDATGMERSESEHGFTRRESVSGRRERAERQYGDLERLERSAPTPRSPRSPRGGRFRSGSGSTASHTGSRSSSHSYSDHPLPPLPGEQPPLPPLPGRYARYTNSRPGSPTPVASRQGSDGHVPQLMMHAQDYAPQIRAESESTHDGASYIHGPAASYSASDRHGAASYNASDSRHAGSYVTDRLGGSYSTTDRSGGSYSTSDGRSGGSYTTSDNPGPRPFIPGPPVPYAHIRPVPPMPTRSPSLPTTPSYSPHGSGPNSPLPLPQFPGMRRTNSAQGNRQPPL